MVVALVVAVVVVMTAAVVLTVSCLTIRCLTAGYQTAFLIPSQTHIGKSSAERWQHTAQLQWDEVEWIGLQQGFRKVRHHGRTVRTQAGGEAGEGEERLGVVDEGGGREGRKPSFSLSIFLTLFLSFFFILFLVTVVATVTHPTPPVSLWSPTRRISYTILLLLPLLPRFPLLPLLPLFIAPAPALTLAQPLSLAPCLQANPEFLHIISHREVDIVD